MAWVSDRNSLVNTYLQSIPYPMKPDFRKCMIWLHTYSGLILGWLLFAIFVTGTLSYFNHEISQWMKPEHDKKYHINNQVNHSITQLKLHAQGEQRWQILLPSERIPQWMLRWNTGQKRGSLILNGNGETTQKIRASRGGDFFRTFHYTLHIRQYGGRYIAGIAAMFMLIATFSGIFTHRRFFRDFFTLRKGKKGKFLIDIHALLGIVTIPFSLMICISGLMIYLTLYIPWSDQHFYADGENKLNSYTIPTLVKLDPNAQDIERIVDFSVIKDQIQRQWPGKHQIARVTIEQPQKINARIIVERVKDSTVSRQAQRLVFSASTGEALDNYPKYITPAQVRQVLWGIHEAKFADIPLRWMFFALGCAASALIATGLIIWLNKRLARVKQRHIGHFIVERLNIAAISGLLLAIIGYFVSNRAFPVILEARENAEVQVFFISWLMALCHAVVRPVTKAWYEQVALASVSCFGLFLLDIIQEPQRLINAILDNNMPYWGFSVMLLLVGSILYQTANWLHHRQVKADKV